MTSRTTHVARRIATVSEADEHKMTVVRSNTNGSSSTVMTDHSRPGGLTIHRPPVVVGHTRYKIVLQPLRARARATLADYGGNVNLQEDPGREHRNDDVRIHC